MVNKQAAKEQIVNAGLEAARKELLAELGDAVYRSSDSTLRAAHRDIFEKLELVDELLSDSGMDGAAATVTHSASTGASSTKTSSVASSSSKDETQPSSTARSSLRNRPALAEFAKFEQSYAARRSASSRLNQSDSTATGSGTPAPDFGGASSSQASEMGSTRCPSCGAPVAPDDAFCMQCGSTLQGTSGLAAQNNRVCPSCGAPAASDSLFCQQCGSRL